MTYTGAKQVESGLPPEKPKALKVKFTKAGSYKVYCDFHPGMEATVKVVKKGARIPTAAQDKAAVKKQADAAIRTAKALAKAKPAANTVELGVAGKGGVETLAMNPAKLTVPAGTAVRFVMPKASYEVAHRDVRPGQPDDRAGLLPRDDREVLRGARARPARRLPE